MEPVSEAEVLTGGLPPVCLGPADGAGEWFRGYTQAYVERDVRQLSQIGDWVSFRNLAQLAALRTAQVLTVSSLARDAKLTAATAGRYLSLLEASFLIRRLPPFQKNRGSRLVKSPKLHFSDSGLAAHLAGVKTIAPGQNDLLRGALFETYAAQNPPPSWKPMRRTPSWLFGMSTAATRWTSSSRRRAVCSPLR